MGLTFDQAMNKLQNGKSVNRTGWSSSNYLILLYGISTIYEVFPSNLLNPCSPYACTMNDLNGTDWQTLN